MLIPGSSGSLRVIELFGIPVRVHFTFLFLVFGFALFTSTRGEPASMVAMVFALILVSVVLHELGHALTARTFGIGTREIVLYPIGGITRLDRVPSGTAELIIAVAGPMVNLAIALGLTVIMELSGMSWSFSGGVAAVLPWTAVANLFLCLFNLLPAFPMDGGRILRAFLSLIVPEERATRFATAVGQGLAVLLGLFAVFGPGQNLVLLLVALFIFFGASQEASHNRTLSLLRGRTASEAMMTRFESLAPQDSLEWAARLFLATHQRDFPVIDGWRRVAGLLDRASLLRGLALHGRQGAVLEAMNREPLTVGPDSPLVEVLRMMVSPSQRTILVIDEDSLEGIVTLEKLTQLIEILPRL